VEAAEARSFPGCSFPPWRLGVSLAPPCWDEGPCGCFWQECNKGRTETLSIFWFGELSRGSLVKGTRYKPRALVGRSRLSVALWRWKFSLMTSMEGPHFSKNFLCICTSTFQSRFCAEVHFCSEGNQMNQFHVLVVMFSV